MQPPDRETQLMRYTAILVLVGLGIVWTALLLVYGVPQPQPDFKPLGSWWATVLYNYQTLITGVLAVGAAGGTIIVMVQTDRNQDDRHQQLLEKSRETEAEAERRHRQLFEQARLPNKLLVERALTPQLRHLRDLQAQITMIVTELDASNSLEEQCSTVLASLPEIGVYPEVIRKILNQPAMMECRPLFGGQLTFEMNVLQTFVGLLENVGRDTLQRMEGIAKTIGPELAASQVQRDALTVANNVRVVQSSLNVVISGLSELGELYEIQG